ncbi:MAG: pseudouridine synthase [Piptocephalis tieghemiana]|nr:MAG: pseudouridine synthase [Piptocephalis tieghemiana]
MTTDPYASWTREQLIVRLAQLEGAPGTSSPSSTSPTQQSSSTKKAKRRNRVYDPSKYAVRHIALKIAYMGGAYHGLALQDKPDDHVPTVEKFLFHALRVTRLVPPEEGSKFNYTRCGRTDKGVSALSQVVALHIRSNQDHRSPLVLRSDAYPEEDPDVKEVPELPYLDLLNKLLPSDIRVLAWSPVSPDFHARFSCTGREYRYYLPLRGLSLSRMQEAAKVFEGQHDFRNFCKIDPTKNVKTHERTIRVSEVIGPQEEPKDGEEGWAVYRIVGSAFLWHQVRCMTAMILLVGGGHEPVSSIHSLLDTTEFPSRPAYDLASDIPLVLHDCIYPKGLLSWRSDVQTRGTLERIWRSMRAASEKRYTEHLILQSFHRTIHRSLAEEWATAGKPTFSKDKLTEETEEGWWEVCMGGGEFVRSRSYQPVLRRKRCLGVEEHEALRQKRLQSKKVKREDNLSDSK